MCQRLTPPPADASPVAGSHDPGCRRADVDAGTLTLAGERLVADPCGALYWPDRHTVAVADLHLEKGSHFARRGRLLPPYDTLATLSRLEAVIARWAPRRVLCLGDSFHDRTAAERLPDAARTQLSRLVAAVDWVWITGNHDPSPPAGLGGRVTDAERDGALTFRHDAACRPPTDGCAEISGHLHPVAAIRLPGRRVRDRCFVGDGRRLVLPAFGAYAGGLNVLDSAFTSILAPSFEVRLLVRGRAHRLVRAQLVPDGP